MITSAQPGRWRLRRPCERDKDEPQATICVSSAARYDTEAGDNATHGAIVRGWGRTSYSLRCRRPNRQAGPHKFAQRHCTCSCEGRPSIASVRPSVMSETTPARSQRRDALHHSVQRRANKKQNQPFRNPMQLRNGTTPQYFPLSPQVCAVSGSRQHQLTPL